MIYNLLHKFSTSHYLSRNILTEKSLAFRLLYPLFRKIKWTKTIRKNGRMYTIRLNDGIGLMNFFPDYETWLDPLIARLLSLQDGIFIDVGANTGQTLLKTVPFFPEVSYFAIEPNVNCVNYLNDLCRANGFERVRILNYALSNEEGETGLLMRYPDDVLATTTPAFRKFTRYSSRVTVPVTRGDTLVSAEKPVGISILKIDVEGGESKVIEGFMKSIRLYQPYIICEILPLVTRSDEVTEFRKISAGKILAMLSELDYAIWNIITKKEVKTIADISTSLESGNYLLFPAVRKNQLFN